MSFETRSYRILVVSSSEKFNASIHRILQDNHFDPIQYTGSIASAKREILEHTYDMVLVNAPLPDEFGTRFAIDCVAEKSTICTMLVKADIHDGVYAKVTGQGVFTLSKPAPAQTIITALKWMIAARERVRKLEKKNTSIENKMEEIRIVNKAKWVLIDELKMTEDDAHRYISKQAMDRCLSKREVAQSIINTYKR